MDRRIREPVSDLPVQMIYTSNAVRDQIKHHRIWSVWVCHALQESAVSQEGTVGTAHMILYAQVELSRAEVVVSLVGAVMRAKTPQHM